MSDKLEEIDYYYEKARLEGKDLDSKLKFTPVTFDIPSGEFKCWSVTTYGEFVDESYRIACNVPITRLYQRFEIARGSGIDKLEQLLRFVKGFHREMKKKEVKYVVKFTPIRHMDELLTNLESLIEEEIKNINSLNSKKSTP